MQALIQWAGFINYSGLCLVFCILKTDSLSSGPIWKWSTLVCFLSLLTQRRCAWLHYNLLIQQHVAMTVGRVPTPETWPGPPFFWRMRKAFLFQLTPTRGQGSIKMKSDLNYFVRTFVLKNRKVVFHMDTHWSTTDQRRTFTHVFFCIQYNGKKRIKYLIIISD